VKPHTVLRLMNVSYLSELKKCVICGWKCNVNRLSGERGVCRVGVPEIAYTSYAYVLKSYSVTLLGCCFRCMYCNAYRISQYPDAGWLYRGYSPPEHVAAEVQRALETATAQKIGVRGLSFTGGEASIHIPYLEAVVAKTKETVPDLRVGVATNGFATSQTLKRLLAIATYINFEIKAFDDSVHQLLTGASVKPVLRNAEFVLSRYPEKIRVIRSVVVPDITDAEVLKVAEFIKDINPSIHFRLIGFRPSYMLYYHPGPTKRSMEKLVRSCKDLGLKNVDYSGYYPVTPSMKELHAGATSLQLAANYLKLAGCLSEPRNCGSCAVKHHCAATLMEPWLAKRPN
jgi:pyruvate formate lyase activating enzyme